MNEYFPNRIGNEDNVSGDKYMLKSPVNGSVIGYGYMGNRETVLRAIESSADAFTKWSSVPLIKRKRIILKLSEIMQEKADKYAYLESLNTGKTLRQSTFFDTSLSIEHVRYFATSDDFKAERKILHPEYPGTEGIIQYCPMGVVASIVPWNVPLLMAIWKSVPPILSGNTVILKPSHYTPVTAIELSRDFAKAGLPPGVLNIVSGEGSVVGETLAKSSQVRVLSFTGSTATGMKVSEMAAGTIKRVIMELGGKSPNIVFDDADMDRAARGILMGIFLHSGQLCESGSRLLVQKNAMEKLLHRLRFYMGKIHPGDPLDMTTDLSAITTLKQKEKIEGMVHNGIQDGARIGLKVDIDGQVPRGGIYYPPLILEDVYPDMEIFREEIFGPVLTITEFENENEAIELANDTRYGLAGGIWTSNTQKALEIAGKIDAGTLWINDYHLASAAAPRGGFKDSGIGRELGLEGILEYTQTRHIFVRNKNDELSDVAFGLICSDQ